ncbi:MAG: signal peptidase II [Victivallaceae bacterium]|nr:signal peptidase II [Victivallaceae bacterium]
MAATPSSTDTEPRLSVRPRTGGELRLLAASGLTAVALLAADQFTKITAERLLKGHPPVTVVPDFFSLAFVTNKGAAWGIFHGYAVLLLAVAAIVTVLAIWNFRRLTEGFIERYWALAVILSGVAGNAIDRLWRGEVIDFLDFQFGGWHFPTFNLADCAITCGVIIYIASNLFRGSADGKRSDAGGEQLS